MVIYIVTQESYEGSTIIAVFTDKRLANVLADTLNTKANLGYSVEEWETDLEDPRVNYLNSGYNLYSVQMGKNGCVFNVKNANDYLEYYSTDSLSLPPSVPGSKIYLLNGYVWATSEEHAIKIANEKRIMLIANNEW